MATNQVVAPTQGAAIDPFVFKEIFWPHHKFYNKQEEIIESVRDNFETVVHAAHKMGKDYIAGFIALWFFFAYYPCRVITTSVKDDHLDVLWGEIYRFIDEAQYPLKHKNGGPFIVKHHEIKKIVGGDVCKLSYLKGLVSKKGEGMMGHHAPHTLLIYDECSGGEDMTYNACKSWAKRILLIGNPYECENFFRYSVEAGDELYEDMLRKRTDSRRRSKETR